MGLIASKNTCYSPWTTVSLPMAPPTPPETATGWCALWFNPETLIYTTSQVALWGDNALITRLILVAVYLVEYQIVTGPSAPYKINGAIRGELQAFSGLTHRLILPDKMYFLSNTPLPLYKSSIFPFCPSIENFKTVLIDLGNTTTSPSYKYFYEDIDLNPTTLPSTFRIGIKTNASTHPNLYTYYKDITKVVTDPSTKTSATPKIMHIGDSLTNLEIPYQIKTKLAALSITATMCGTMENIGGEYGEGRGGWAFRHFIGQDTNLYGYKVNPCTVQPIYNPTFSNPFVRLATADDKTNHPTWCFRSTGAENELSYQSDEIKTGDFYIFDFENYLTNNSLTDPDIITIGLSTNDFLRGSDIVDPHDVVTKSISDIIDLNLFALEIMITSIHAACPNAKIGIIPAPVISDCDWGCIMWNAVSEWIEECITYVNSLNASSYLSIVPVWCHMDRSWNWDYATIADISSINTEKKASRNELIHWLKQGIHQYTDALLAYVVSVL